MSPRFRRHPALLPLAAFSAVFCADAAAQEPRLEPRPEPRLVTREPAGLTLPAGEVPLGVAPLAGETVEQTADESGLPAPRKIGRAHV